MSAPPPLPLRSSSPPPAYEEDMQPLSPLPPPPPSYEETATAPPTKKTKKKNIKAATITKDDKKKSTKSTSTSGKAKSTKKMTKTAADGKKQTKKPSKSGAVSKVKKSKAKSGKCAAGNTEMTKLKKGASVAYWAYKAYQVARLCCGDVTVVAQLASELLDEGNLELLKDPSLIVDAVEGVFNLYGGLKKFRKSVKKFSVFSRDLSNQFRIQASAAPCSNGGGDSVGVAAAMEQAGASMEQAASIYRLFTEADTDGDETISLKEFVVFCQNEGVPTSSAEMMFFQADTDGNGTISFEEWTKMMVGRVGRDESSFNCAGHHGMTPYVVRINGLECDWCSKLIPAGSTAVGCRRCDCDACTECLQANSPCLEKAGGGLNCVGEHGLEFSAFPGSFSCDWCRTVVHGQPAVECRVCYCDGCMECAATGLQSYSVSPRTCPERHGLERLRIPGSEYKCDCCSQRFIAGTSSFSCRICEVDVCVPCVWKDHQRALTTGRRFSCHGNHEMRAFHVMAYGDLSHRCDWCLNNPLMGDRLLRCDVCDTDVCNKCLIMSCTAPSTQKHLATPPSPSPPPAYGGCSDSDSDNSDVRVARPVEHAMYQADAIVRVLGSGDNELDGKLMVVVGFEPNIDSDEDDVVVLQKRGMVVRTPSAHVYNVLDG